MTEDRRDAQSDITRRQALKRVAAAGAVAWAVPTIQTLNMRSAWAQGASPLTVCYRIKTNGAANCVGGFGANDCLDPTSGPFGSLQNCPAGPTFSPCCDFYVSTTVVSTCIWEVTVDPDCKIIGATSKNATACHQFPGTNTNTITINTCTIDQHAISHVELAVCCPQTQSVQGSAATTSGTTNSGNGGLGSGSTGGGAG